MCIVSMSGEGKEGCRHMQQQGGVSIDQAHHWGRGGCEVSAAGHGDGIGEADGGHAVTQ